MIAVIIPYYMEPPEWIRRAIDSVLSQGVGATPFLMAEGPVQDWIDHLPVRHIKLGKAHADYGDTPRAVGSLLALREGATAIAYLDADNYYEPGHLERMQRVLNEHGADVATCQRILIRPDGSKIGLDRGEDFRKHTDTSCYLLGPAAFSATPIWALMPRPLSIIGDRVFWLALQQRGLKIVHLSQPGVNYTTLWQTHYIANGETPPPAAKPNPDQHALLQWWAGQTEVERNRIRQVLGIPDFSLGT